MREREFFSVIGVALWLMLSYGWLLFEAAAARHIRIREDMEFSVSGTLATMANGLAYSIGAAVAFPGRQVVTLTGDGCFLMTAMEVSTAAREGLPVKFFVLDDQAYH